MSDATIRCPSCGHGFPLTESLAGPLVAQVRADLAAKLAAEKEAGERALAEQKAATEKAVAAERAAAEKALSQQKAEITAAAKAAAAEASAVELAEMKARAEEQDRALKEARAAQAQALRRERELREKEEALDLAVEEKLAAALREEAAKRAAAQKEADARRAAEMEERMAAKAAELEEAAARRAAEKDQHIDTLKRQIETLQRKAEQGSQQRQGEAAEVILEDTLGGAFPGDVIEPVGKGVRGADCIQRVTGPGGVAGAILWEVKETQNWSKDWLPKLREDMRQCGADLCVLVSRVRPEGVETFAQVDGVWIAAPRYAVPLATVLRGTLLEVAAAKGQRQGQATKTEMLYDYLTGPQFRARVEAMVERFDDLRADLVRERKTMMALWAKREKALGLAQDAMIGMYGDVQGIAGAAMPEIAGLDVPLLDDVED